MRSIRKVMEDRRLKKNREEYKHHFVKEKVCRNCGASITEECISRHDPPLPPGESGSIYHRCADGGYGVYETIVYYAADPPK